MTADAPERNYAVGYGKPPAATRFQRGRSGNPRGRPKGSKDFNTLLAAELDRVVEVTLDGKTRKLAMRQLIVRRVVNDAAKGKIDPLLKLSAATQGANAAPSREHEPETNGSPSYGDADDARVFDDLIEEITQVITDKQKKEGSS